MIVHINLWARTRASPDWTPFPTLLEGSQLISGGKMSVTCRTMMRFPPWFCPVKATQCAPRFELNDCLQSLALTEQKQLPWMHGADYLRTRLIAEKEPEFKESLRATPWCYSPFLSVNSHGMLRKNFFSFIVSIRTRWNHFAGNILVMSTAQQSSRGRFHYHVFFGLLGTSHIIDLVKSCPRMLYKSGFHG